MTSLAGFYDTIYEYSFGIVHTGRCPDSVQFPALLGHIEGFHVEDYVYNFRMQSKPVEMKTALSELLANSQWV